MPVQSHHLFYRSVTYLVFFVISGGQIAVASTTSHDNDGPYYYNKGAAFSDAYEIPQAIEAFNKALHLVNSRSNIDPSDGSHVYTKADIYDYMATQYARLGKHEKTIYYATKCIAQHNSKFEKNCLERRGFAYLQLHQLKRFARDYAAAGDYSQLAHAFSGVKGWETQEIIFAQRCLANKQDKYFWPRCENELQAVYKSKGGAYAEIADAITKGQGLSLAAEYEKHGEFRKAAEVLEMQEIYANSDTGTGSHAQLSAKQYAEMGKLYAQAGKYNKAIHAYKVSLGKNKYEITKNNSPSYIIAGANAVRTTMPENYAGISGAYRSNNELAYAMIWDFLATDSRGEKSRAYSTLKQNAATLTSTAWPYPVIEYILHQTDHASMRVLAKKSYHLCEAAMFTYYWRISQLKPANYNSFFSLQNKENTLDTDAGNEDCDYGNSGDGLDYAIKEAMSSNMQLRNLVDYIKAHPHPTQNTVASSTSIFSKILAGVGLYIAATGIKHGDTRLTNQGIDTFSEAMGVTPPPHIPTPSNTNSSTVATDPVEAPVSASGQCFNVSPGCVKSRTETLYHTDGSYYMTSYDYNNECGHDLIIHYCLSNGGCHTYTVSTEPGWISFGSLDLTKPINHPTPRIVYSYIGLKDLVHPDLAQQCVAKLGW